MPPFVHTVINTTLAVVVVTVAMMNEENRELGEVETMRTLGGGNDSYKRPTTGSTITPNGVYTKAFSCSIARNSVQMVYASFSSGKQVQFSTPTSLRTNLFIA